MLPKLTAVSITDPYHELWGATGFVQHRAGETFRGDGVVPSDHLVIAYPPETVGFRDELVHEDNVRIEGC